ncbi:hypothetical protein CRE_03176 [Caenorhabditis remanei]|uniref:Uncharacterized protein n=1 Tax=Caenorhabditis remanei TaxID=31234 RepID=E3LWZ0_CAERE|nr:hypothetical protein CRE_03176 [Caenorhabditis remanei]
MDSQSERVNGQKILEQGAAEVDRESTVSETESDTKPETAKGGFETKLEGDTVLIQNPEIKCVLSLEQLLQQLAEGPAPDNTEASTSFIPPIFSMLPMISSPAPTTPPMPLDVGMVFEQFLQDQRLPSQEKTPRQLKDAQRKRYRRSLETPEETQIRLAKALEYKRKKYDHETDEEQRARLERDAIRKRAERTNESEEKARLRKSKAAEHRRNYLAKESEEKARIRREKDAERRRNSLKNESPEAAQERKAKNAARRRESLKKETEDETLRRRSRDAERRRLYLLNETDEQKERRKTQDAARKRVHRQMKPDDFLTMDADVLLSAMSSDMLAVNPDTKTDPNLSNSLSVMP